MDSLKIGNITLPHRAVFGPMAGFTDAPCRRLMAQHGAGFTVSEMVSSRALVYHDHKTVSLLKAEPNGAPYGVQIFGEVPQIMGEAAAAIEEYQFDFLDINMGCPAPKIVSGGAGSKLMLDPDLCGRIVEQVKAHTTRPVTVKMRLGFEAGSETYLLLGQLVQESGAQMITLHARTRSQFYEGRADWSAIGKLKRRVSIPVVGNGDVTCWQDALRMREETGCDGVAVGRAAQGNPWIFRQIADAMAGKAAVEPTNEEKFDVLRRHLHALAQFKSEAVAVREMRRHIVCYVRGMRDAARLRVRVNAITDIGEMESALRAFMLEGRV